MQQVQSISVDKLPNIGYLSSKEKHREEFNKNESHIPEKTFLPGVKASFFKLTNDVLTYFPKGFAGSKNSDFYEYLSMGMVPYLIGSAMLYAVYKGANFFFNSGDKASADKTAKCLGAGVVLYGLGKLLYQKITHKAISLSTGVDLDWLYVKKINELPEPGQEKGLVREQPSKIYASVQFFRNDLMDKDGELNHDDVYYHYDKIAKKAGFKEKLNASNQIVNEKIRGVIARTTALENIGKYIVAATGVALGNQEAFKNIKLTSPRSIVDTFKEAARQLWKGSERNIFTKHSGKALVIASAAATVLTWLIPTIGFKHNPNTIKTKVDTNKEYEVC